LVWHQEEHPACKKLSDEVFGLQCGVVVSGVRRMNEVNPCRAQLVLGCVTLWAGTPARYVTSQLGQLSLAPCRVAKSCTSFVGVKAGMSPLPDGR